jgi:hypothetical protein
MNNQMDNFDTGMVVVTSRDQMVREDPEGQIKKAVRAKRSQAYGWY